MKNFSGLGTSLLWLFTVLAAPLSQAGEYSGDLRNLTLACRGADSSAGEGWVLNLRKQELNLISFDSKGHIVSTVLKYQLDSVMTKSNFAKKYWLFGEETTNVVSMEGTFRGCSEAGSNVAPESSIITHAEVRFFPETGTGRLIFDTHQSKSGASRKIVLLCAAIVE